MFADQLLQRHARAKQKPHLIARLITALARGAKPARAHDPREIEKVRIEIEKQKAEAAFWARRTGF